MKSRILLAMVLTLTLLGCGEDAKPPVVPPGTPPTTGPTIRPKASSADLAAVARCGNRFALDLYARLAAGKQGENLFCSPFSISSALAMTSAGARGNTAKQIKKTLHFTMDEKDFHPAVGALIHDLGTPKQKRGYQLSIANALWAEKSHKFLPAFLAVNQKCYGAGTRLMNFRKDSEGARKTINSWVAKQTRDKIQDLLARGLLDARTRLVLTNAVYFKGDWSSKFDKADTENRPFHLTEEKFLYVSTMYQYSRFRYLREKQFRLLEMPYAGDRLSMLILLPEKIDGLAALEKSLTAEQLDGWVRRAYQHKLKVYLPRFKLSCQFSLKKDLSAMGMTDAFTMKADFSGMDGVPASDPDSLYITAVVHKAFVDVNEEGSEAAAATAVVASPKNGGGHRPAEVFRVDRPFLFAIRDRESGCILFLGRITNPQGLSTPAPTGKRPSPKY
jgi:serine protease inhibitor